MCQFPPFPFHAYVFSMEQFGYPRIKAYLRLPEAYRS